MSRYVIRNGQHIEVEEIPVPDASAAAPKGKRPRVFPPKNAKYTAFLESWIDRLDAARRPSVGMYRAALAEDMRIMPAIERPAPRLDEVDPEEAKRQREEVYRRRVEHMKRIDAENAAELEKQRAAGLIPDHVLRRGTLNPGE
jgi:hypothetical protein